MPKTGHRSLFKIFNSTGEGGLFPLFTSASWYDLKYCFQPNNWFMHSLPIAIASKILFHRTAVCWMMNERMLPQKFGLTLAEAVSVACWQWDGLSLWLMLERQGQQLPQQYPKSDRKGWVLAMGERNWVTGLIQIEMSTACPIGSMEFPLGPYSLADF